jgi:tensin
MVLIKHIMLANFGIKKKCHVRMVSFFYLIEINSLKTKPAGTFLIRDSQGFPGSYGLAVKVETLPPGIQAKQGLLFDLDDITNECLLTLGADPNAELVRHYLIERTPTGHVRLKGCPNEPDFGAQIFSSQ